MKKAGIRPQKRRNKALARRRQFKLFLTVLIVGLLAAKWFSSNTAEAAVEVETPVVRTCVDYSLGDSFADIDIKWSEVNADSYEFAFNDDSVTVLEDNQRRCYMVRSDDHDVTLTYKVRACKKVGGKKYYSDWCKGTLLIQKTNGKGSSS